MKTYAQLLASLLQAQHYGQAHQVQCLLRGGSWAQAALFGDAMARRKYHRLTGGCAMPIARIS